MVTAYNNSTCKYSYDRLTKEVYLINQNALRDIHIDDMAAYVDGITQEPLVFHVYNLNVQDTDSLDERYEFAHQITFSIKGYANYKDFLNRFYVIVKDYDGTYWLCNPLFPCKVTFTYTLDSVDSRTDFNLNTVSNHPLLRLVGFDGGRNYECNNYDLSSFQSLWLNEKLYSMRDGDDVIFTNGGFKEIIFQKNSQVFTENFDGENVQHTISFDINFDDYKSSWHYNLLEFTDNLYSAIIQNWNGDYLLCGFGFGLQPSYTVTASDEQEPNKIEIVLRDLHDNGDFVVVTDTATITHNGELYWVWDKSVVECLGDNQARYLLKKQVDAIDNPTGKYQCLEGYEERFSNLDIVGTFSESFTFSSSQCHDDKCEIFTSIPNVIEFDSLGCKRYSLRCDSDWSIDKHALGLTVTPSSGVANQDYTVEICNLLTPSDTPIQDYLTLNFCDVTRRIDTVISFKTDCFYGGDHITISSNGQYVTFPTNCVVSSVLEVTNTVTEIVINEGSIKVYVPQNDTSDERLITLNAVIKGGGVSNIYITQTQIFENWVKIGSNCYYGEKCDIYRRYTGTTSTTIFQPTNDYKTVDCVQSAECGNIYTRWVETEETVCNGGKKYIVEQEQFSFDEITWTDTPNKRQGQQIDDITHECSSVEDEEWRVVDGYVCDGTTMYAKEELYRLEDGIWYPTGIYRKSDIIIEEDSPTCGYEPTWRWEKWVVVPNEYLCNDGNKYEKKRKYVSNDDVETIEEVTNWTPTDVYEMGELIEAQSTDCGYDPDISGNCTTYIDNGDTVCDGVNKYQYLRKYVRECVDCNDCSAEWIPTDEYLKGELIQADSLDCGYVPSGEYTQWRESGTQCNGYDLYQVYTKWISDDNVQWYETSITKLGDEPIEEDSPSCGYEPVIEYEYQWILTTNTECDGYNKMYLYKKQRRIKDSGAPWEDVIPTVYSIDGEGTMQPQIAEEDAPECGYVPPIEPIYEWRVVPNDWICGICGEVIDEKWVRKSVYCQRYDKYAIEEKFETSDGENWYPTGEERSVLVEIDSLDCGYVFDGKFKAMYSDGRVNKIDCNDTTVLNSWETKTIAYTVSAMTSAVIGDCVTTIGYESFSNLTNLETVTIGGNVAKIDTRAFSGCTSLTSISIPNSVTTISNEAFRRCTTLTSVVIPNSVTKLDQQAFASCSGLTDVTIGNSVTKIDIGDFGGCISLTSVTIGNSVSEIGASAFYGCSALPSITIPNSVVNIKNSAFYNCTSLASVTIPNSVELIEGDAFEYCSGLTSVTIGNSVARIGSNAFRHCSGLTSITIFATVPPVFYQASSLGVHAFDNTNNCPIFVPSSSVTAYKTEWSTYADRIVGLPI